MLSHGSLEAGLCKYGQDTGRLAFFLMTWLVTLGLWEALRQREHRQLGWDPSYCPV